jgi:hypothetical protein
MTTISWLTLFREIIAVYCENHTKHINTLVGYVLLKLVLYAVTIDLYTAKC